MEKKDAQMKKRLAKKAKRGFRGFPVGSIACYGPDDRRASKLVAAIVDREGEEPGEMRKWYSEEADLRDSGEVAEEVLSFLTERGVRSVLMPDRIIGCPHEEGVDYEGPVCPQCPFWANRDRWAGVLHD